MLCCRPYVPKLLLFLLTVLLPVALDAQATKVRGRVVDDSTGEPMPYVSVFFYGTSVGTTTDEQGRYYIETRDSSAILLTAELLGYHTATGRVSPGAFSTLDFSLRPAVEGLTAARIVPDDTYIRWILKQIDEHRALHDYELGDPWTVRVYSKIELDATHADWLVEKPPFAKLLGEAAALRDTSAVTGVSYIPFMISETFSQKYHSSEPDVDREVILANRISGVGPDNFMKQYTGSYLLKTNFYKSTINLFNLDVPSPAAAYGHGFYNYFLVDSLELDGRKSYCLRFHPKRGVTSPVFDGELFIDAEDFGIRSAHVALAKSSNVNWIRHINIDTENRRTGEGRWFPREEKLFIDFSIAVRDSSRILSFLGNRELHYGEPTRREMPTEVLKSPDVVVTSQAMELEEEVWESHRPVPLSPREAAIYTTVAAIQLKPSYKAWYTLARTLVVGYVEGETTDVAFGPWAQIVKYNSTEGWHIGGGFRTTRFYHPKLRLSGSLGYGFRDHLVKGGGKMEYMFRRDKTRKLTVSGSYDYRQLGQGSAVITQPNMLNSLLAGRSGDKQTLMREFSAEYEHEFSTSFTSYFRLESQRLMGNASVPLYRRDSSLAPSVSVNQIRYAARFSWGERINRGRYDKAHIFTRYPVVGVDLRWGVKGVTHDDFGFFRGDLTFDWKIPSGLLGFASVHMDAGIIRGSVPYPFLKLHEGNQSIFLDKTAFTCMEYYEFASDSWVSLMYEHNLDGLILGHIPLIKRLDLREIVTVKAAWGTLSGRNRNGEILPIEGMGTLEIPYVEAGVGLSNILRVLRVDATWRLTHRHPDRRNFRVTLGFDIQF